MTRGLSAPAWRAMAAGDVKAALAAPRLARSPHLALQHTRRPAPQELSTGGDPIGAAAVDESLRWGFIVPKRHARRAVTRNLIRRQMREALRRHSGRIDGGLWLLRLQAAFGAHFRSAASAALQAAVRTELDALIARAVGAPRR